MPTLDSLARLRRETVDLYTPAEVDRILRYYEATNDLWECPFLSPVDRVYLTCVTEAGRPMACLEVRRLRARRRYAERRKRVA